MKVAPDFSAPQMLSVLKIELMHVQHSCSVVEITEKPFFPIRGNMCSHHLSFTSFHVYRKILAHHSFVLSQKQRQNSSYESDRNFVSFVLSSIQKQACKITHYLNAFLCLFVCCVHRWDEKFIASGTLTALGGRVIVQTVFLAF